MTATLAPATGLPAASMTVPLRVRSGFSAGRTCGAPIGPLAAGSGSPPAAVFFFQAEDGIRDLYVTGVQTCGLPILSSSLTQRGVPSILETSRNPPLGQARRYFGWAALKTSAPAFLRNSCAEARTSSQRD